VTEGAPRRVHFLICTNERGADAPLPCCAARGGRDLLDAFQAEFARRGWPRGVKVSGATCLTTCQHGPTVVVYPEGIWYGGVSEVDVCELFDAHLCERGEPAVVTRLRVPSTTRIW
jgi:(2Fe-2S) ferredoxin